MVTDQQNPYSGQTLWYFQRSPQRCPCLERCNGNFHCSDGSHYAAPTYWPPKCARPTKTTWKSDQHMNKRSLQCFHPLRMIWYNQKNHKHNIFVEKCVLTSPFEIVSSEDGVFPLPWQWSSMESPSLILPTGDCTHTFTAVGGSKTQRGIHVRPSTSTFSCRRLASWNHWSLLMELCWEVRRVTPWLSGHIWSQGRQQSFGWGGVFFFCILFYFAIGK